MTDAEIKQAMKAIATVTGLKLTDDRIERDFATYKSYLDAMARIERVQLPVEAEPMPIVALKPQGRS